MELVGALPSVCCVRIQKSEERERERDHVAILFYAIRVLERGLNPCGPVLSPFVFDSLLAAPYSLKGNVSDIELATNPRNLYLNGSYRDPRQTHLPPSTIR